jgi:hypothetical protein
MIQIPNGDALDTGATAIPAEYRDDGDRRIIRLDSTPTDGSGLSGGSLPAWLSTNHSGGSSTVNGFSASDPATLTVESGGASTSDYGSIDGPAIDLSEWTEVRMSWLGLTCGVDDDKRVWLGATTNPTGFDSESLHYILQDADQDIVCAVRSGGSRAANASTVGGAHTVKRDYAIRVYDYGSGPQTEWYIDGNLYCDAQAIPSGDVTFRAAITARNTAANRSMTMDRMVLELIP